MAETDEHSNLTACIHVDRRSTLKALALTGVALVGGLGLATPARATWAQEGWRWCAKCMGMFYAEHAGDLGNCRYGGGHDPRHSGHYYMRSGAGIAGVQEGGWSWCDKCMGLWFSAGPTRGHCPEGGTHSNPWGAPYAVPLGDDAIGQQGGWRKCRKCMGLFYIHFGSRDCPGDGQHEAAGSLSYACLF